MRPSGGAGAPSARSRRAAWARPLAVLALLSGGSAALAADDAPPTVTVEAGFDFTAYEPAAVEAAEGLWLPDGSRRWYSSETARAGIQARWGNRLTLDARLEAPFDGSPLAADDALRELAVSWNAGDYVALTAGKQNLKWGTARVFSSEDTLSPALDPLDPAGTKRGVAGLRADVIPTWWASLSAVAIPAYRLERSTLGLRAEFLAGETDLALGAVRSVDSEGNETPAVFADAARFFDRFGVYAEAQAKGRKGLQDLRDWGLAATAGFQADFPAWLNGTVTFLAECRWAENDPRLPDSLDEDASRALYAGLSGIPLSRSVNARLYGLCLTETGQGPLGTVLLGTALSWSPDQGISVSLGYELLGADKKDDGTLLPYLTPNRHRVDAGVTVWY